MKKLMEILSMVLVSIKETGWDGLILVLLSFLYLKPQKIFNFKLMQETKYVLVNHYSKLLYCYHNHVFLYNYTSYTAMKFNKFSLHKRVCSGVRYYKQKLHTYPPYILFPDHVCLHQYNYSIKQGLALEINLGRYMSCMMLC